MNKDLQLKQENSCFSFHIRAKTEPCIPLTFYKNNGNTGEKLLPENRSNSTRLQELPLMNNTNFGDTHYDILLIWNVTTPLVDFFRICQYPNVKHFTTYVN